MGRKESARRWVGMSPGDGSDVVSMQKLEENWHGRSQKRKSAWRYLERICG